MQNAQMQKYKMRSPERRGGKIEAFTPWLTGKGTNKSFRLFTKQNYFLNVKHLHPD